jgi:hypothetical protein
LIVYLAARRRWRALAWTSVTMVATALLVLPVLGAGPWNAFVTKQLPRLQSGEAFAFFEGDPGVIAGNFSIYGLVFKLDLLGVADMTRRVAGQLAWVYTGFLVVLAWRIGRRPGEAGDRGADVRVWLGLLNLAALRSPLAPGMYVASGAVWMFVLLAAAAERRSWWLWTRTALAWILAGGAPPLASPAMSVLASLPSQVTYIVANAWPLGRRVRAESGE